MAYIHGRIKPEPLAGKAMPTDAASIEKRLKALGKDITSNHADQLELLVRFDDCYGWKNLGATNCAAWMNLYLGISPQLGWEYLRVGRKLRELPVTRTLFQVGQLTWSKVRILTRVADPDNEPTLCHAALDASVTQVDSLCDEYRWQKANDDDARKSETERAWQQWQARSLRWDKISNGNVRISLSLPPEVAQGFLKSIEHSMSVLEESVSENECDSKADEHQEQSQRQDQNQGQSPDAEITMSQKRADAAVFMAEASIQSPKQSLSMADRYQVVVSVDMEDLQDSKTKNPDAQVPKGVSKKPTVSGAGSIARETARRLACDCSVSAILHLNGEPMDIGQKGRLWPAAMARAIKIRDQHCQFPGCKQSQHLHIHHIIHWADGGSTSMENGCCLCPAHHRVVHEGGYRIERVKNHERRMLEQFQQQTVNASHPAFDVERHLRNSPESFDKVRAVSPTRFRFRVVDKQGKDILASGFSCHDSTQVERSSRPSSSTGDTASVRAPLKVPVKVRVNAPSNTSQIKPETVSVNSANVNSANVNFANVDSLRIDSTRVWQHT